MERIAPPLPLMPTAKAAGSVSVIVKFDELDAKGSIVASFYYEDGTVAGMTRAPLTSIAHLLCAPDIVRDITSWWLYTPSIRAQALAVRRIVREYEP